MGRNNHYTGSWIVLTLALLSACSAPLTVSPDKTGAALAPHGNLRVGVYTGSPSSIIGPGTGKDAKGVGFELGRALATRLGVPFDPVVFASNDGVLAAMKTAQIDVTFTNATAERAQNMDFSQTYLDVEKSFLVSGGSNINRYADMQRAGLRIGISKGSSTAEELRPMYPNAQLIEIPTLARAGEMLAHGEIDAFATNDAILYQLSDTLPGARVLAGHWGVEHFAAAIPKGRANALPFLNQFIADARAQGLVKQAAERANLRGVVPPPPSAKASVTL